MGKLFITGLIAGLFFSPGGFAKDDHEHHREHGSHTHGLMQLNIAVEASKLLIELESPAINIVGFEHQPENESDRAALNAALAELRQPGQLFVANPEAGCKNTDHEIEHDMEEGQHKHDKQEHRDFEVEYEFTCANTASLRQIDIRLFKVFPKTHNVDVQFISDSGQHAVRLNESHTVFRLPGK